MASEQTATDTFALLSDGSRIDILRAVALAQYEQDLSNSGVTPLTFSEIYERVDVDNTSKLSYHLGELTGVYLRKSDAGYSFTHAGEQIVRFILAENFRQPSDVDAIETDGICPYCGETRLEAGLEDQYFVVRCLSCEKPVSGYIVTPAQTRSFSETELLDSFNRKQSIDFGLVQQGICPECVGQISIEIRDLSDHPQLDEIPVSYFTIAECQECMRRYSGPLPYSVAFRPPSIAFHWDHGVDILGTGWWELHRYLVKGRWTAERISDDPPEYRVVLRRDDATLRAFLNDEAQIVRTERVRRQGVD